MNEWNCCRTCLSEQALNPIFVNKDYNEKYTHAIFTATGTKVEINDNLPQEMCYDCIKTINKVTKFQKKCQESLTRLLEMINNKKYKAKWEPDNKFKTENIDFTSIDISDCVPLNEDSNFNDYDDDVPLESFKNTLNNKTEDASSDKELKSSKIMVKRKRKLNAAKERIEQERVRQKDDSLDGAKEKEETVCEYCHKVLSSRSSLRNHYKIHTGFDVVCEHCGKKFITRRLLLMHCRAKHGYEKTDKCSYCDYKASNAEQVKIHERLHTGEKPYVCKDCGTSFHRRSNYLQHIAIHLPDKTVQCDQCPALFKSVTLMRIHKNRHRTPTHKYKCSICESVFARRRNATRHLQRIHAMDSEPGLLVRTSVS